jgi:hypothetical protein
LLKDSDADWPHVSLTHLAEPGSYGLSAERWRYIHYANGDEELYDCQTDRYEWTNLAAVAEHAPKLAELRRLAPQQFAPCVPPKDQPLPKLSWHSVAESQPPASRPDGGDFDIVLLNQHEDRLNLYTLDRQGKRESRGSIASGWRLSRTTRPGTVWLVTDLKDRPLGYFVVEDRNALAVIPEAE